MTQKEIGNNELDVNDPAYWELDPDQKDDLKRRWEELGRKRLESRKKDVEDWREWNLEIKGEDALFSEQVFVRLTSHIALKVSPVFRTESGLLYARETWDDPEAEGGVRVEFTPVNLRSELLEPIQKWLE